MLWFLPVLVQRAVAVICLLSLYPFFLAIRNIFFHPLSKYPGPWLRATFFWPELWTTLTGNSVPTHKALHDQYGHVVRIAPDALSYNDPQAWRDIHGFPEKGKPQMRKDRTGFGDSPDDENILVANDNDHARIRKLLSHAMSDAALRKQEPIVAAHQENLLEKFYARIEGPEKGITDLTHWCTFTAFDIIGDIGLGSSFGAVDAGGYHSWIANLFASIKFLGILRVAETYKWVGRLMHCAMETFPAMQKSRDLHIKLTKDKTLGRMKTVTEREDFMTHVMKYPSNDPRSMNEKETVQTFAFLIVAATETVSTAACGAMYLTLSHPHVHQRLRQEIRDAFPTKESIRYSTIATLPYLNAVIEESLRRYTPAPASFPRRTTVEGNVICGEYVPPNMQVAVHQWSTYLSESNFADPLTFDPDRWLEPTPEKYKNDKKHALQPFGLGPRGCIGKNIFYLEVRSLLVRLFWHFDIELCEESKNWMDHKAFLMWEKPQLLVKLSKRQEGV
ncbi:cytochrome P450 monooxygenase-like protein [Westerdykella ornata]|uniref:Cytochrome P450 monooxygenase-like protein n=1 Tax=Westerdykella ornata TaxID=318751 RepID=A0A6A6JTT4_WESOR|nr:cytochrome P450 monooxygenase-like protein [Westerdykella ornata]KAF2279248.1 cytochrome P450 monooxygenase-like protein [Westerdykella ornata]